MVTFQVLKTAANTITPYLKFTGEVAENEKAIPVLDTVMKIAKFQGGQSWHQN